MLIGAFVGVLVVVLGIGALLVTGSQKPGPQTPCPTPPCGPPEPPSPGPFPTPSANPSPLPSPPPSPPPTPAGGAPALVTGQVFTSAKLGYRIEFDASLWAITKETDNDVELQVQSDRVTVIVQIRGVPATEATPQELLDQRKGDLADQILGLAEQTKPRDRVLEPAVGFRSGVGAAFSGVADTPQGPGSPVDVVIMAASDCQAADASQCPAGTSTISVTLITDDSVKGPAFSAVDSLMNQFRFPSEIVK